MNEVDQQTGRVHHRRQHQLDGWLSTKHGKNSGEPRIAKAMSEIDNDPKECTINYNTNSTDDECKPNTAGS